MENWTWNTILSSQYFTPNRSPIFHGWFFSLGFGLWVLQWLKIKHFFYPNINALYDFASHQSCLRSQPGTDPDRRQPYPSGCHKASQRWWGLGFTKCYSVNLQPFASKIRSFANRIWKKNRSTCPPKLTSIPSEYCWWKKTLASAMPVYL